MLFAPHSLLSDVACRWGWGGTRHMDRAQQSRRDSISMATNVHCPCLEMPCEWKWLTVRGAV